MKIMREGMSEMIQSFFAVKYLDHVNTFDANNIRDFTDMLVLARQEAENDPDEKNLDKLTDEHIEMTLVDVFFFRNSIIAVDSSFCRFVHGSLPGDTSQSPGRG